MNYKLNQFVPLTGYTGLHLISIQQHPTGSCPYSTFPQVMFTEKLIPRWFCLDEIWCTAVVLDLLDLNTGTFI